MMRSILSVLTIGLTASGALTAQDAFGYTSTTAVPFSYTDISGTGAAVLTGADDSTATLALPFGFKFYGITYNSICASTNGLLSFGACVANDYVNLDLTGQVPIPDVPLIAPFWMDLTFAAQGGGSIYYQTLGAAPTRRFVIQWNNVFSLNASDAINFQLILAEGTNTLLFQYLNVQSGSSKVDRGAGATVGIRGAGAPANGYRLQFSNNVPILANNMAIQFMPPSAAVIPVDVSASISYTTSAFTFNRPAQTFNGTITLTNKSALPLARPLTAVLLNLTPGVTAVAPSGVTSEGPYYNLPGTVSLPPGGSITFAVSFKNTANDRINFTVKTYSGAAF